MEHYAPELMAELGRGEKLIWSGRPRQGVYFRTADLFLVPFSTLWFGFALFWEGTVLLRGGAPFFFSIVGALFVVLGAYFWAGRFIHDAWRRRRTLYGLTEKRVIVMSGGSVKSVRLAGGFELSIKRHGSGRATIQFGTPVSIFSMSNANQLNIWTGAPTVPTFEQIEEGERVYAEIKRIVGL